jgi:hypothetical protein
MHHLGWATRRDLAKLTAVEILSGATMGSVRVWGIGGLFSFVGYFRHAVLGPYRAYATNDVDTVALRFGKDVVVVTPETPVEFVAAIQRQRGEA